MVILLMCIHLAAAAVLTAGWRMKVFRFPPSLFPALFLLPLWGPACAVVTELHIRGGEKADEEAGMSRFGITDEVYRNIRMEAGLPDVLPIEDVLDAGTPTERRKLLLSVLHRGPERFIKPLRAAGVNDDTEVVHYAVTALVELRSSYAQRLAEMDKRLESHPSDPAVMLAAADLDEEYLASGIPEDAEKAARAAHCRDLLKKLQDYLPWQEKGRESFADGHTASGAAAGKVPPVDKGQILKRLGQICLLQGDEKGLVGAENAARDLMEGRPDSEDGYLLALRARAAAKNGAGVREILSEIREKGIYLSPDARRELEFWEA